MRTDGGERGLAAGSRAKAAAAASAAAARAPSAYAAYAARTALREEAAFLSAP